MKVTLDLDQLLSEGKITQIEYENLSELAAKSTGSLAFNILIGFGVMAVSGVALALVPAPTTAIVIGLFILIAGLALLRSGWEQWRVFSNICILVGALMTGGGIVTEFKGSLLSILSVTAIFSLAAIFARNTLLAVLATLMLSASIGARTGYFHASYFLIIQEPTITVILFSVLAIGLYQLSKKLSAEYERIAQLNMKGLQLHRQEQEFSLSISVFGRVLFGAIAPTQEKSLFQIPFLLFYGL